MKASTRRAKVTRSMALRRAERHIERWYRIVYLRDHPPKPYEREFSIKWWRVYQLVDTRDGSVFYVGKTYLPDERLKTHIRDAKRGVNDVKCDRIREILSAGNEVDFRTVALFTDHIRALDHEAKLIREMPFLTNKPRADWGSSRRSNYCG